MEERAATADYRADTCHSERNSLSENDSGIEEPGSECGKTLDKPAPEAQNSAADAGSSAVSELSKAMALMKAIVGAVGL